MSVCETCGHDAELHEHLRVGADCSVSGCDCTDLTGDDARTHGLHLPDVHLSDLHLSDLHLSELLHHEGRPHHDTRPGHEPAPIEDPIDL